MGVRIIEELPEGLAACQDNTVTREWMEEEYGPQVYQGLRAAAAPYAHLLAESYAAAMFINLCDHRSDDDPRLCAALLQAVVAYAFTSGEGDEARTVADALLKMIGVKHGLGHPHFHHDDLLRVIQIMLPHHLQDRLNRLEAEQQAAGDAPV
ncbi:MAG: hypothetical protein A3J48_01025 [Candidatus Doudnabacteria bacterium RIFCSPHIGHO2_02_FULL_46_11]|uniref:Uncharacterized protein n=1 Tax=Candidatus Doudnabacteria bacterium RIFCSPHIGHO2_02_FULL_46_11 TaxID=1817832 RepID=A0A1F5P7Z6_9BACT|nr:MAG: hypothetical protein A3J48_01025 [Candidatus Doudnabacteria bacterium RIFCSPHIGHO2_02_FULL_46_11]